MKPFDFPKNDVVVVIPAYNEALVLGSVLLKVCQYANTVIVVDDGSGDDTSEVAKLAGVEIITLEKNGGKAKAIMIGFARAKEAKPKVTIMLDADGQHDPDEIPKLADPVLSGKADLVVGSRYLTADDSAEIPAYRKLGQKVLNEATNLSSGIKCSDSQSGYRALSRKALENLDFCSEGYDIESDMLTHFAARGLKITEVPISVTYDVPHKHKMNPVRHGLSVLSRVVQIISFKKPVCVFGIPGLLFVIIGIVLAVHAFEIVAATGIWATNVTLLSALLILIGLLMCMVTLMMYFILEMFGDLRRSVS